MVWQAACVVRQWLDFESHRMFICQVLELRNDPEKAGKDELMHVAFKTFCKPGETFEEKGW
jgi:flavin reductase (DIM6/NTAB) family NADH-FMN oxidoreductase RutF